VDDIEKEIVEAMKGLVNTGNEYSVQVQGLHGGIDISVFVLGGKKKKSILSLNYPDVKHISNFLAESINNFYIANGKLA
jgi:hypothetical protein